MSTATVILTAVLSSGGFFSVLTVLLNRYFSRKDKDSEDIKIIKKALLGQLHRTLVTDCMRYIERGYITASELEDLRIYTYEPYRALGGNGTGEALMCKVQKLPIR